jgi:putative Ig domain-containing protein
MTMTIDGDMPAGMVGDRYETKLAAIGGSPPYQWATIDYTFLPSGLQLDQEGRISGIPTVAEEVTSLTVQVTDAVGATARRDFSLTINPALKIPRSIDLTAGVERPRFLAQLRAAGGAPPYTWALARGSKLPDGLSLDPNTGQINGTPTSTGTTRFTVQAKDAVGHSDEADFSIKVSPTPLWRHPVRRLRHRAVGRTNITGLSIKVRPQSWRLHPFERLSHVGNWLALFALGVPAFGAIWILIYSFTTPGSHLTYLGVGILTSLAAFLSGCLIGFLFGIPRVVSSGQLRHDKGTSAYSPSSNLAEVSDWLTKLLLGAGLVQLTRLGTPIGRLIDSVAGGLYSAAAGGSSQSAKVVAGAILIGYTVIGLLDGYVVTIVWYQRKIASL